MKNRSITLIVLTVLAIFAGGIQQTQAQNHWTLAGSATPTSGYIIIGNSAPTDLGALGPSTTPVYLSSGGGDTITLEPGNTATSSSQEVIDIETTNNTMNNYGTIHDTYSSGYGVLLDNTGNVLNNWGTINAYLAVYLAANGNTLNNWGLLTGDYPVYIDANSNTVNNWGTINATATYGFEIYGTGNIVNNWGVITSPDEYLFYVDGANTTVNNRGEITTSSDYAFAFYANNFTLNNWGTISSAYGTIYSDSGSNFILNNWGALSCTGDYVIYTEGNSTVTINNWSGGTISSPYCPIYFDGGANNTINNWGMITSTGEYGIYSDGNYFTLNNWGTVSSVSKQAVYNDGDNFVLKNWGTLISGGDGVDSYGANGLLINWGLISGGGLGVFVEGNNNTLNLNGHSSVIGKITFETGYTGNVANLNFTGVNAAYLKNVLLPSLLAQGVNSGVPIPSGTLKFMLRGVNYVIDAPVVNENITSYQLQGVTPNQAAIGASLDSITYNPPPGSPLFNLFNAIDTSGNVPAALEALSPQQYEAFGDLAIANASAWVLEIDERLNNIRGGSESIDTSGIGGDTVAALVTGNSKDEGGKEMKESKAVETTPVPNRWGFFASGNGLFFRGNRQDADLQDAKANTVGTLAGVDAKIGDHAVAGVLFAYENSPVDLGNGGNATIESYAGGLYGGWHDDGFYVNGLAAYTRNNYTSTRSIAFPGFAAASNGSTNGNQATANIDGGYDWNVTDRFAVGPIAGLQYVHLDINGFDEAGAGAAGLAIGDQDMDSLQSRLGLHAEYRLLTTAVSSFAAEAHAAWQHEYLNDSRAITASFEGGGLTPFAVQTASPQRDAAVVGADINYTVHNRLTLFAGYDLQIWNSSYFEQTVNAGARITW